MDGDSYRARPADWADDRTDRQEGAGTNESVALAEDRFNAHAVLRALARHEGPQEVYSEEMYDGTEDTEAHETHAADGENVEPEETCDDASDVSSVDGPVTDRDDEAPADTFDHLSDAGSSAEPFDTLQEFLEEDDIPAGDDSPEPAASAGPDAFEGETDMSAEALDDGMDSPTAGLVETRESRDDPAAVLEEDGDHVGAAQPSSGEEQPREITAGSEWPDFPAWEDDEKAEHADAADTIVAAEESLGIVDAFSETDAVEDEETDVADTASFGTDGITDDTPLFDAEAASLDVAAEDDTAMEIDDSEPAGVVTSEAAEDEADEGSDLASIIGALGLSAQTEDAPEAAALNEQGAVGPDDEAPADAHQHDWHGAPDEPRAGHAEMDDDNSILASIASASAKDETPVDAIAYDEAGPDATAPESASADLDDDEAELAVYAPPGAGAAATDAASQVFASIDDPDIPGRKPRIALMGEFSAGKSTLSNLLIGATPLPTRVTATQLPPVWISWGEGQAYREDLDGTTHAIDVERIADIDPAQTRVIRLFCQSDILELCDIIDMPGISDPNMSPEVWERVIGKADGVIWCTHATQAWRQSEAAVWESLDPALFAKSLLLITRFDKLRTEIDRARVLKRVERETRDLFAARLPISLTGALGAGEDAEKWEQSGAADFTDRLVSLLNDLSSALGSKSHDPLDRSFDDADRPAAAPRPRSVQVHRPRTETLGAPRRVMPRRVRPVPEGDQRNAHT